MKIKLSVFLVLFLNFNTMQNDKKLNESVKDFIVYFIIKKIIDDKKDKSNENKIISEYNKTLLNKKLEETIDENKEKITNKIDQLINLKLENIFIYNNNNNELNENIIKTSVNKINTNIENAYKKNNIKIYKKDEIENLFKLKENHHILKKYIEIINNIFIKKSQVSQDNKNIINYEFNLNVENKEVNDFLYDLIEHRNKTERSLYDKSLIKGIRIDNFRENMDNVFFNKILKITNIVFQYQNKERTGFITGFISRFVKNSFFNKEKYLNFINKFNPDQKKLLERLTMSPVALSFILEMAIRSKKSEFPIPYFTLASIIPVVYTSNKILRL